MTRSTTSPHGIGSYIQKINNEYIEKHGDTFIDESSGDVTTTYVEEAGLKSVPIPDTTLGAGDTIEIRFHIPDGKTARFLESHVFNENYVTNGLVISVNLSDGTTIFSSNVTHDKQEPIATQAGPADCYVQIQNTDTAEQRASGMIEYANEDTA